MKRKYLFPNLFRVIFLSLLLMVKFGAQAQIKIKNHDLKALIPHNKLEVTLIGNNLLEIDTITVEKKYANKLQIRFEDTRNKRIQLVIHISQEDSTPLEKVLNLFIQPGGPEGSDEKQQFPYEINLEPEQTEEESAPQPHLSLGEKTPYEVEQHIYLLKPRILEENDTYHGLIGSMGNEIEKLEFMNCELQTITLTLQVDKSYKKKLSKEEVYGNLEELLGESGVQFDLLKNNKSVVPQTLVEVADFGENIDRDVLMMKMALDSINQRYPFKFPPVIQVVEADFEDQKYQIDISYQISLPNSLDTRLAFNDKAQEIERKVNDPSYEDLSNCEFEFNPDDNTMRLTFSNYETHYELGKVPELKILLDQVGSWLKEAKSANLRVESFTLITETYESSEFLRYPSEVLYNGKMGNLSPVKYMINNNSEQKAIPQNKELTITDQELLKLVAINHYLENKSNIKLPAPELKINQNKEFDDYKTLLIIQFE